MIDDNPDNWYECDNCQKDIHEQHTFFCQKCDQVFCHECIKGHVREDNVACGVE